MSDRIGSRRLGLLLVTAMILWPAASWAQDDQEETKGINSGNYNIQESMEAGYRQDWINGNQNTYDTFVNLGSGSRLFDYTLNMRSLNHQGIFFDNLNFSNFGYGGDPDNVSRLRIEKNKWYDFSLVFRRHKDFWDYNLLANPLNPVPIGTTNPVFPTTTSPHSLDLVRRMQDYNLTLLPQSRVRFRLGFTRNVNEGPSLTSFHGTTDFLLAQNFRVTTNSYHAGVDFRVLPGTTISYDQFLEYDKQDTSDSLANTPFLVSTSAFPGPVPVDLGLDWYYPPTATTTPCAAPFPAGSPGFASSTCKEFSSYSRADPTRNFIPTERLGFQSTYFKRLEMSGAASYSSGHNVVSNLFDSANEWTNPSATAGQVRDAMVSGPAEIKEVFVQANWSAIYSLTHNVRILDSVVYNNWRTPGVFNQTSTNVFARRPAVVGQTGILLPIAPFAPLVPSGPTFASICPGPAYNAVTCPQHGTGSAADTQSAQNSTFLGQRILSNTVQLEVDLTKRITGHLGYLYETRQIAEFSVTPVVGAVYYPGGGGSAVNDFLAARGSCAFPAGSNILPAGCALNTDGSITFTPAPPTTPVRGVSEIHEQVGLAGFSVHPMDTLSINGDFEFGYNSYSYTRVWPRQIQSYKIHASYRPRTWATIDGAIDIHENRDNVQLVNNLEHGRTYSFAAVLAPNEKFVFTLGYNYTDISLQTLICFRDTFGTMTGAGLPTFSACPPVLVIAGDAAAITLGATSFYSSKQHFVYSDIMWRPVKRVTASVGYNATYVGGSTLFLNPLQPAGTLAFNNLKPFASIRIDLYKGLSYRTTWNYYGYNAKTPFNVSVPITGGTLALAPIPGPDFNGSTATFAVRYAF